MQELRQLLVHDPFPFVPPTAKIICYFSCCDAISNTLLCPVSLCIYFTLLVILAMMSKQVAYPSLCTCFAFWVIMFVAFFYMTENLFKAPIKAPVLKHKHECVFFTLYHGSKYKEHSRTAYVGGKNIF